MTSFCGFCGAKAIDERAHFCSDCGGKLEHSVEEASSTKSTMPLPSLEPPNEPGIILSRSFVDLIRQEASIGKEISPAASVELSKSFLSSISDTTEEPMLSRDTLREVPPLEASDIPVKEPVITLPDFLAPMQHLAPLEPMTLPAETSPRSPAIKLQKIATPAAPAPALDLVRDTLPETRTTQRALPKPLAIEEEPSVLLSTSMEEIILKDTQKTEEIPKIEPKPEPKEEKIKPPAPLAEVFPVAPKLPFPKLEAPPKSVLLAEPPSIVSEGFAERLAKQSRLSLFSTVEVQRAARSRWVQALLLVITGPLLARILQDTLWGGFARLSSLFIGLLVCLLFFRLLAEERQPLWRSLTPLLISYALGLAAVKLLPPNSAGDLLHIGASSLLSMALISGALGVSWWLGPRLRILTQPIDGLLLGTFSGAGYTAGLLPVQGLELSFFGVLFAQMLCGGLAGYFWGLSWHKEGEKKSLIAAATLGVSLLHLVLSMLSGEALRADGSPVGLLLFTLLLLFGYLVLFGYAIKLKLLERN